MKAVLRIILLTVAWLMAATGYASAAGNPNYAALVIHADSGDVLFSRHADERRYPASLTKMMTLYLLFDELDAGTLTLSSELTVSAQAAGQPPSKLGLTVGTKMTVEDAINALVIKSANDAAVVVAEAISGSEWRFAQKMTQKAHALGMTHTTFRNASGLPNSKQTTTARDLAALGRRLIQDHPDYYPYFSRTSFVWNGKTYTTHNALVKTYAGAEGLKTGYTRRSGFNLVTSANRDGSRLIGVVMGGRSVRTRDAHMRLILDNAFAELHQDPTLIAALHRETPSPRIKPTLLAELEKAGRAPMIAGDKGVQAQIYAASEEFTSDPEDAIGSLIAAADSDDFNEYERVRLASLAPGDVNVSALGDRTIGEGDADAVTGWSVQIGAYSSKTLAQQELEAAASVAGFDSNSRAVQAVPSASGGALYRARFTALSAIEAADLCQTLRSRKLSCFVISDATTQ